jgi:hypothetical protein
MLVPRFGTFLHGFAWLAFVSHGWHFTSLSPPKKKIYVALAKGIKE